VPPLAPLWATAASRGEAVPVAPPHTNGRTGGATEKVRAESSDAKSNTSMRGNGKGEQRGPGDSRAPLSDPRARLPELDARIDEVVGLTAALPDQLAALIEGQTEIRRAIDDLARRVSVVEREREHPRTLWQ